MALTALGNEVVVGAYAELPNSGEVWNKVEAFGVPTMPADTSFKAFASALNAEVNEEPLNEVEKVVEVVKLAVPRSTT